MTWRYRSPRWIATTFSLAMTKVAFDFAMKGEVCDCEMTGNMRLLDDGVAFGLAMTDANCVIASVARQSMS